MFKAGNNQNQSAQSAQSTNVRRKASVLDLGNILGAAVSRASHGEVVAKMTEQLQVLANEVKTRLWTKTAIIPLDNASNSLQLSSVHVVCSNDKRAVVFSLILDGTGTARSPREYKGANGRVCEVPRVAGDLYNDAYWDMVQQLLKPSIGALEIEDAGGCVIPSDFDLTDAATLRILFNCVVNAIAHNYNLYVPMEERAFFNVADFADTDWVAKTMFQPGVGRNAVGSPIRRNFEISTTGRVRGANDDVQRDTTTLSRVSGYVSLQYVGKSDLRDAYGNPIPTEQQYLPVINITDTALEQDAVTPELQLFALLTTFRLSQRGAWINCFRPRYGNDQSINLHRLDGLGKELSLVIDTTDPQFDPYTFLRTYAYEDPMFVLHVDQVGPLSWLLNIIADAGAGVPEAEQAVFDSLDRLSNGIFRSIYKPTRNVPAFMTMDDVILNGWYVDQKGERQDLRDIDVLAILNLTQDNDISLAMEFEQTFNPATGSPEERIHRRVEIIKQVTSNHFRIDSMSRPVVISGELLEFAWLAVQQAGMNIRSEGTSEAPTAPIRENLALRQMAVRSIDQQQRGGAVSGQWQPAYRSHYTR